MPKSNFKKIAITTGDRTGIGFEVTAKALTKLPASARKNRAIFFVFRHVEQSKTQSKYFKLIDKRWLRLTFASLDKALLFLKLIEKNLPDNLLIDLALETSEAEWVVRATHACRDKALDSLVTGPLSKKVTSTLPGKELGHTGIFRRVFPKHDLFMAFVGRDFHVLLATDHIPLAKVEPQLLKSGLAPVLKSAFDLRRLLGSQKPIAVLGLNPHAGEKSLIGKAESVLFRKNTAALKKYHAHGPIVPDAAFLKTNRARYSLFVCLYHDQGLIPFKMHHGQDSGVHLTMGLPFVRTSVDHGTAEDLYNKNKANPASMLEAIHLNLKLSQRS